MLIFQDLAVVVMVLLIPMLGEGGGSALGLLWALLKAGGLIVIVLTLATRVMPHVLEAVARTCSPEIFLLTVVAICLGTANQSGWGQPLTGGVSGGAAGQREPLWAAGSGRDFAAPDYF